MASGAPPPPLPTVAVAVRPGGSASRRAARWAAASLLQDDGAGRAAAIAFVHVIPPLSFVPSPTGERVPVAQVGRDAAEAYSHDRHARAQEALLPFRRLCGGRAYANVETVVVEGDGVAEALVRYAAESGVRSLVLGSASFRWFQSKAKFKKGSWTKKKKAKSGGKAQDSEPSAASGTKSSTSAGSTCFYCKADGHWKRNCSKYLDDKAKSGGVTSNSGTGKN